MREAVEVKRKVVLGEEAVSFLPLPHLISRQPYNVLWNLLSNFQGHLTGREEYNDYTAHASKRIILTFQHKNNNSSQTQQCLNIQLQE
jgi:hypothetical protein